MGVFTYLLKSERDGSYYTGISEHIDQRLGQHNNGEVASTSSKRPWSLVYKKEHQDYNEARKHEKWLKKKNRQYKDKLAGAACPVPEGGVTLPVEAVKKLGWREKQKVVVKKD